MSAPPKPGPVLPRTVAARFRTPPRRPLVLVALSAVCFALMGVGTKLAAAHMTGAQISAVRFAVTLLPVLLIPSLRRRATTFSRRDLLLYRGILGGLAALLFFLAIERIGLGLATLLNFTSPIFSVVFAAWFLGERLDRRLFLPLGVALGGVVLASGADAPTLGGLRFGAWEAVALGSGILGGAAVTVVRAARRSESSWSIYGSLCLFGLLASLPPALRDLPGRLPAEAWLWLAVVAAGSTGAHLLLTYAYRWVTNLEAGVVLQLNVVVSLAVGALALGESFTALQIVGCAVTLAGVLGVIRYQSPPRAVV